jgi:hypothetical protein
MFVIPKPDRQVPDPVAHDYLPPEGREVEKSQYWLRRVNDEDVTVEEPASKTKGGGK